MMDMRIRSVSALGTLGLVLASLAACSNGGSAGGSGGGKTLDVLVSTNAQYPAEQKAWFASTAAKFKAQTGATITWETFASASDELTKIQTSVVSGEGPDVYGIGTTFTPTAHSTRAFVTVGEKEWKAIGGRDKFVASSLGISGPSATDQVGIPFVSRPFVLAYNKDLLKAAGIDKPATTWDELTAQAKKLTTKDTFGLAIAYKDNFDPWKFIWGMSLQAGNPLIEGKTAKIDDPIVKSAYETYFGWLTKDKVVDPASVGWANAQALAAFAQGKAAYFPMATYTSAPTFDKSAVKDSYGYALLPTVPPGATERPSTGKEAASILSGDNLVVADYSKDKDLAFQFVKMITDKDAQDEYFRIFGQLPVNAQSAEALKSNEKLSVIADALSKSVATPFTGAWGDTQLALTNVVVQSVPDLAGAGVSESDLAGRLATAQKAAQTAVDRAK